MYINDRWQDILAIKEILKKKKLGFQRIIGLLKNIIYTQKLECKI